MKAAIYARVSSDKQDVDLSVSAQLKHTREFAKKNHYKISREYVDEVVTGRTTQRPQFQQMIADARMMSKPFDVILVYKYSRFARNREDSVVFKSRLKKQGIRVISITEPFEDSPTGKLMEGIIESLDEFYSANLAQEIQRGMRESASRGFYMPGRAPYGYNRIKVKDGSKERPTLERNPRTSPIVSRIYRDFLVSMGLKEVTAALNSDGISSPRGKRWNKTTVHKILVNRAYTGTLVWGVSGESGLPPIIVENAWEALIDKATFESVQEMLKSRSFMNAHPRRSASRYLLSGLVKCGSCKKALTGTSAKSGKHSYYVCGSLLQKGAGSCTARYLPAPALENRVLKVISGQILEDGNIQELVRLVGEEMSNLSGDRQSRILIFEGERRDVESRLDRLYEALETGTLGLEDLAPRIKSLRQQQEHLLDSTEQLREELRSNRPVSLNIEAIRNHVRELREVLEQGSTAERRAFIKSFVKGIEITGGDALMTYSLPLGSKGDTDGYDEVLSIVHDGGPSWTRTTDLSLIRTAL